jgi:hypothetical protein
MFERYENIHTYNELFTVSIPIPYMLLFVFLAMAGYGWITSKTMSTKWAWFFLGSGEVLLAFLSLKLLPLFCTTDKQMMFITGLFCLISFALICGGLFRFKKLSQKP